MNATGIAWTEETWNPVTGCTKVSAGCKHCYAERLWSRLSAPGAPYAGRTFTDVAMHPERLRLADWKKPKMIFVNSMSDLFHERVTDDFIERVLGAVATRPTSIFQILTKRPERLARFTYPDNTWVGVSVERQQEADRRIAHLLRAKAKVRFLSCEPLLAPMDVSEYLPSLDWMIAGGESGPKRRPLERAWVEDLLAQCRSHAVPFFMKQWSPPAPIPEDLLIREWPHDRAH